MSSSKAWSGADRHPPGDRPAVGGGTSHPEGQGLCSTALKIPARSWGLNRGEERFLGSPVGMVTLAGCSASCLFCYLADGDDRTTGLTGDEFVETVRDLRVRGATCLYLVNPEGAPTQVLVAALAELRGLEPGFPVVVKLGGHEPLSLSRALRPVVDAVSLDAKVFTETDAESWLGVADYGARLAANLSFWRRSLGPFRPNEGRVAGVWMRHLVLPGRSGAWGNGLDLLPGGDGVPVWVSLEYRPFGRARPHPVLGSRLRPEERLEAGSVAASLRERRFLWVE